MPAAETLIRVISAPAADYDWVRPAELTPIAERLVAFVELPEALADLFTDRRAA